MKFVLAHDEDQSMKRSRFTEEQIIGILKEHEVGHTTALTARMEDTLRVRLHLPPAPGSGAALCRWLRASSRRYHRPTGQIQWLERTQNWIKSGGKVTPNQRVGGRGGALHFDERL
ncbi:hypothetical protein DAA53_38895 [Bradyrhizobium sp. WBAH23]|nr:hypothetical protein DAA53_38895 [Bradyrhizobium sp. WBAH23]